MTNFLLILILLVIVLGPLGLIVGFGVGAVLLVIAVISLPLLLLVRLVTASEKALRSALPERPPPGGDHVRRESDGWYCVVVGARFGPWSDRVIAENVMKVERRRKVPVCDS